MDAAQGTGMQKQTCNHREISLAEVNLHLRADGSLLIPQDSILIVSDLHLGKDAAFRAAGIPVPAGINRDLLKQLTRSVETADCSHLIFLGDLIHNRNSLTPSVIDEMRNWRKQHQDLDVTLVLGNHDRHVRGFPPSWKLKTCRSYQVDALTLVHDPATGKAQNAAPFICGHLHPAVQTGVAADRMKLRCFAHYPDHLVVPAFGPFKGGMTLSTRKMIDCFAIAENQIWSVKQR